MARLQTRELASALAAGARALSRGEWEEARAAYREAVSAEETAEAFEGLGWASFWLDDGPATLEARHAAYLLYRRRGDQRGAARVATRLAEDYLTFRVESAVSNGWLRRAERLLTDVEAAPEHGWLALFNGHFALLLAGETSEARRRSDEVVAIGRALPDAALEMLGLALDGLARVSEGDVREGMARLDEAAAAATSGELENLEAVIWTYCYLLFACERVRDYARAVQWCETAKAFSSRYSQRVCFAVCRAHHAAILMWRGDFDGAASELEPAAAYLDARRPGLGADGLARLGELRLRRGRLDEAAELFARAGGHPLALLGRARLALERGQPADAAELAERVLRMQPSTTLTERVAPLELLVRAHVAEGHIGVARSAAEELRETAGAIGTEALLASASEAAGLVAAATGDHESARRHLEDAIGYYDRAGSRFHGAACRIELARLLGALGRTAAAAAEASAARDVVRALGADLDVAHAEAVLGELERPSDGLSAREAEVLALVAEGLSDKAIAERLVLSPRTVNAHLRTIYRKLGVRTRTEAVLRAAERRRPL